MPRGMHKFHLPLTSSRPDATCQPNRVVTRNIHLHPDDICQPNAVMRAAPSCRDKGWMWGRVGALCLSSWQHDSPAFRQAAWSHSHENKHKAPSSTLPRPLLLHCSRTIRWQTPRKTVRMDKLRQALQPFDEARPRLLRDVHIDAVHLAQFERGNASPVGTFIHLRGIAAERRVLCQDNELGIGGDPAQVYKRANW